MCETSIRPLTSMKPKQKAFIVALNGGTEFERRLVGMGLHIGSEVEILFPCAHVDDPAIVAAGETRLAIGYGMASKIIVGADPV
jgi:ferrous iron transport protein A